MFELSKDLLRRSSPRQLGNDLDSLVKANHGDVEGAAYPYRETVTWLKE